MSEKDGGAAFPFNYVHPDTRGVRGETGMSLRDYFAGEALKSLPMSTAQYDDMADGVQGAGRRSIVAYVIADAMLKERAKP